MYYSMRMKPLVVDVNAYLLVVHFGYTEVMRMVCQSCIHTVVHTT